MAEAKRSGGGMARLALIFAILALLVAWAAYRRQGGEVKTLWRDLTGGAGDRVRITAGSDGEDVRSWLARAQDRLERSRPEVAGERDLRQVREEVAEVRRNLRNAYRDAGTEAKERWRSLDADLERLEAQLRKGGTKALDTLDSALEKIKEETGREER
jgi:hypothetical protein